MTLTTDKLLTTTLLLFFVLSVRQLGYAQVVQTIYNGGPASNRADIVILGDGYTFAQLDKYRADADALIEGMFSQEPFREYQRYFNVHLINVISNESGADHPEFFPPQFRDTALEATYNCRGLPRLICVNKDKAQYIASTYLPPEKTDITIVLVNDPNFGGSSGGSVITSAIFYGFYNVVLHELGHSIGRLADEYQSGGPPDTNCGPGVVPPLERNIESEGDVTYFPRSLQWQYWILPTTPIPTLTPGYVGAYQGARYCTNLYRPTYNSRMRDNNAPFEQVNTEVLVYNIYLNWVAALESSSPIASDFTVPYGQPQRFSITTPPPRTHALEANWYVDDLNNRKGTGDLFITDATTMAPGSSHTVEVRVSDPTNWVLDRFYRGVNPLFSKRTWTLRVAPLTTPNAIDDSRWFTRQQYVDFFNRLPDQGGWDGWTNYIDSCGGDLECKRLRRIVTVRGFMESTEFRIKIGGAFNPAFPGSGDTLYNREYVRQCYLVYLRRSPGPGEDQGWINYLASSGNYDEVTNGFINSYEYRARFGTP